MAGFVVLCFYKPNSVPSASLRREVVICLGPGLLRGLKPRSSLLRVAADLYRQETDNNGNCPLPSVFCPLLSVAPHKSEEQVAPGRCFSHPASYLAGLWALTVPHRSGAPA